MKNLCSLSAQNVWLELARAHARLLNLLSLFVCTCYASEILALVEVLASALLADNCLVARYEPGKELSVSVCHNSEFYWLIAGSTLSYCPVLARDCTPDFLKHTES